MSIDHVATFKKNFEEELKLIKNSKIKKFIFYIIKEYCQDSFWTMPTSSSGKFHPVIVNGEGGLVRHIKLCVAVAQELIRAWDYCYGYDENEEELWGSPGQIDIDVIVAACLLHDLYKNEIPSQSMSHKELIARHGSCLSDDIRNNLNWKNWIDIRTLIDCICIGISSHMGKWTLPINQIPHNVIYSGLGSYVAKIVHNADYIASRQFDKLYEKIGKSKVEIINGEIV